MRRGEHRTEPITYGLTIPCPEEPQLHTITRVRKTRNGKLLKDISQTNDTSYIFVVGKVPNSPVYLRSLNNKC